MKPSACCRLAVCFTFSVLLSASVGADDNPPSVIAPRPNADRRAEAEEAALEDKRKAEHKRDEARGATYSFLATLRIESSGHVKDDVAVMINGDVVHDYVLHDEGFISFVVPTDIVLNKRLRDSSYLEVSVNGKIHLKKIPMSIFALNARRVNFEQFRKQKEEEPFLRTRDKKAETITKESGSFEGQGTSEQNRRPGEKEDDAQAGKANISPGRAEADEYASFVNVMREVNELLQRKKTASSNKVVSLLNEAAKNGNSLAMTTLAALLLSGDYVGVPKDFSAAVTLLEKAVGLGNADAQALLGFLYASGIARPVVHKDTGTAILLWQFAAKAGSQFAKVALAFRHFTGTDVIESCQRAAKLYEEVASQVLHDGSRRSRQDSDKNDDDIFDVRPPVPQEILSISRTRLHEDLETHFSSTQEDYVQYFRHAARRGDPRAQVVMGNFYFYGGPGVPQDLRQARDHFERAARARRMEAHAHLGFMDLRAGRNESAVKHLRKAADAGLKMGHHGLGYAALHGIGMPADPEAAVAHFKKAAEKNVPEAMYNLGVMYRDGMGVPKKPGEALSYFSDAARKGHLKARYTVGLMHYRGTPPARKDCSAAVRQFKEVAESGLWNKILARGLRAYEKGEFGNALYRYLQAAHAGIEVAQYNAAFLYDRNLVNERAGRDAAAGGGAAQERKRAVAEALELYKMSASQGHRDGGPLSQLRVGDLIYEQGEDLAAAAAAYEMAAKLRNAEAMFNLGVMHALGRGLKPDAYMAKRYFDDAKNTDERAYLASTVAVFVLQYSDSLREAYEAMLRLVQRAGLREKWLLVVEKTGLRERMTELTQFEPEMRRLAEGLRADAALLTILLAALVFIVNARQRLVMARRGEDGGGEDVDEVEGERVR